MSDVQIVSCGNCGIPTIDTISGICISCRPFPTTLPAAPTITEADVMLAGIHAVCVGASQEYTRCKGVMPQWDSGFFAGQMHVFDMYTKADKTAISEANEYLSKLSDAAPLPAAPAPTEQETPQQQADIDAVYDFMGIGSQARSLPTLMANLRNMNHFADLLHAVEREFFMVPGEPDEDFPDEEPQDECLLNCWGSTEAEYIEQLRAALAALAARQAPTVPKLDYDLSKLALEQTQERLRQAEEAIAKRDATALRVAQCAGEFARDAAPLPRQAAVQGEWISVVDRLPKCSKKPDSLGVEVIVYPVPEKGESTAFFGCRLTSTPSFYKYGSRIEGVTHWMPIPAAPQAAPDRAKSAPATTEKGKS